MLRPSPQRLCSGGERGTLGLVLQCTLQRSPHRPHRNDIEDSDRGKENAFRSTLVQGVGSGRWFRALVQGVLP